MNGAELAAPHEPRRSAVRSVREPALASARVGLAPALIARLRWPRYISGQAVARTSCNGGVPTPSPNPASMRGDAPKEGCAGLRIVDRPLARLVVPRGRVGLLGKQRTFRDIFLTGLQAADPARRVESFRGPWGEDLIPGLGLLDVGATPWGTHLWHPDSTHGCPRRTPGAKRLESVVSCQTRP